MTVNMRVTPLGCARYSVASAPALGTVGGWNPFSGHGPSEMLIFTWVNKVFCDALGHHKAVDFH